MRTPASFLVAATLVLVTGIAAAEEPAPQETAVPPAAPTTVAAEAKAPPVLVIHDVGWKLGGSGDTRPRSRGLVIGGLATAATGLVGVIAGAALLATDASAPPPSLAACKSPVVLLSPYNQACAYGAAYAGVSDLKKELGVTFTVAGGVALAAGVGMAIAGAWQVPVTAPTAAQQARGVPAVAVGPGQATLRWSF